MKDIFRIMDLIDMANLNSHQTKILYCIIVRLNRNYWNPVPIEASVAGRDMCKNTFLKERKALTADGWIVVQPGKWKTAPAIYNLGPKFKINKNTKKENEMRSRDAIKALVIDIDKQYPDFSSFCAKYKWDRAVEALKAEHPELALSEWPVDSIGDPANRNQAHEMLVKLNRKKRPSQTDERLAEPQGAWSVFDVFVEIWLLSYPKKSSKAAVRAAVKEFRKGKEQWTPEQVKALQKMITTHTVAYVASFGGDIRFMVSPVNYFAAEKWTEKLSVKYDKTDVNYKTAGAPAKPNMPSIKTIKAN
jgi:hypothetical protein